MGEEKEKAQKEEEKKLVLEEYKKTVDIIIYEGTTYWSRFNVLFAVNAAILVFLGVIMGNNSMPSLQTETAKRTIVISICVIGFISSATMLFACLRSQAFYRYWWKHLESLEKKVLKEFTLAGGLDNHFDEQNFLRLLPVNTASLLIPFSLLVLFYSLPIFLFGLFESVFAVVTTSSIGLLMVLWCAYMAFKRSREKHNNTK
jgi:hypothetical protein